MTLLAIVAIHTAANEPPKVRQVMNKIHRNVGLQARGRVRGAGRRDHRHEQPEDGQRRAAEACGQARGRAGEVMGLL